MVEIHLIEESSNSKNKRHRLSKEMNDAEGNKFIEISKWLWKNLFNFQKTDISKDS